MQQHIKRILNWLLRELDWLIAYHCLYLR